MDAALRASESVTLEGSLRKLLAVLSAACFSAQVVPVAGGAEGVATWGEDVRMLAKRDWSSLSWEEGLRLGTAGGVVTEGEAVRRGGRGGEAWRPISSPGTETPACVRRLTAPWFRYPPAAAVSCVASWYGGGGAGA